MTRSIVLAAGLLAVVSPSRADDTITSDVVRAVKQATVYIHVEAPDRNKSGSGFVVSTDGGTALVVTNHHVAVTRPSGDASSKAPAIKVVFDSGTKSERSYLAEIVASDAERDLAVLKVTGVKDAPKPVAYADPIAPVETMAVYSFGFPFGQGLSTGKGSPAITVGRASVSSLRAGDDGELATIQIDGNLNPGNSGGPVVDGKGRLVGVAVAILKEGQGIGFLVPAAEVVRTMEGRLGRVRVNARKGTDGKPAIRIEAELIDPASKIRGVTAYYVIVPPKGKKPDAESLDKYPGSKKLTLKFEKGVAAGDFAIEKVEGEVVVQLVAERLPGEKAVATRVRGFSLYSGFKPEDLAGPPPESWIDHIPKDKSFAVWLPAKPVRQEEKQRNVQVNGEAMRVSSVIGETANGLFYQAEYVVLPAELARNAPVRLHALLRTALLDEGKGRFTDSVEAESGTLQGVQYRIEYGDDVARARVFIGQGGQVRLVRVMGTADQVVAPEAETILLSFRLPGDQVASKAPNRPPAGVPNIPKDIAIARGNDPTIIAGGRAPLFKDVAPKDGLLIGLEIGVGKFGPWDTIKAVRPIYRVGGKEEFGTQRGMRPDSPITLKAKDGYAVGAITCISGLNFDGCSFMFMKVKDGKLDPSDAYESEWVGQKDTKQPTRIGGDGTPVVGIAGRGGEREVNGFGLLFKGQEAFDPNAAPRVGRKEVLVPNGKEPFIFGSIRDPLFKSVGPAGGVLIGLEAKFTKFGSQDIVRAIRPIYRVDGKEENGPLTGADLTGAVKLKAKEGYAVG